MQFLKQIREMGDSVLDTAAISLSNKTTAGGAAAGILGWLASVNWLGVFGVLIALAGLAVNIYFQRRRDRREAREFRARDARETAESNARIEALRARYEP